MKAITLWQPYATLMAYRFKRNETRDWGTDYRGPLAIHAARAPFTQDGERREAFRLCYTEPFQYALREIGITDPMDLPRGCILAVGTLVDVLDTDDPDHVVKLRDALTRKDAPFEKSFGNYGPGRTVWVTERMVRLPEPVQCTGKQGIWTVRPEITTAVLKQLVRAKPSSHVDGIMRDMIAPGVSR